MAAPGRIGRANGRRGEVEAIIDGERRILCLTLGALAEIETAFGVDNIGDLAGRLARGRIGAATIIAILAAALRGGRSGEAGDQSQSRERSDDLSHLILLCFAKERRGNGIARR